MALAIIGDPAAVNWVLVSGQPVTAGEKCSGTTIRSFHEQKPEPEVKVELGAAKPLPPKPISWL